MCKGKDVAQAKHGCTHAQSEVETEIRLSTVPKHRGENTTATQIVGETNSKQKTWIKAMAMTHTSGNQALKAVSPARCVHNQRRPATGA